MCNHPSNAHQLRQACRVCGGTSLLKFLSLGPTPLANAFLASPDEFTTEMSYPLDVYFCRGCGLVQLLDVIDAEILFRNYIYLTGTSDTIAAHNREYARTLVELLNLQEGHLVVEVASNDGSLLECFQPYRVRTLGVEPASNIAALANQKKIETLNEFFDHRLAMRMRQDYQPAKAVIGNNVLAHVDNPVDFLRGFKELLAKDGLAVLEMPYLGDLLDRLEYDTIYHEHLSYFSITTLKALCEQAGLALVRVDRVPVHGGSLRIYAGLPETYGRHTPEVLALVEEEGRQGMQDEARFIRFAQEVAANRQELLSLLTGLKEQGMRLAGYGAPAKGNTLLNYCELHSGLLPYTVDKSPLKVGQYTPGMHIPVLPVTTLLERQPDYVLLLAWNFAAEIIRQQEEYVRRGGKFILPLPTAKVIE